MTILTTAKKAALMKMALLASPEALSFAVERQDMPAKSLFTRSRQKKGKFFFSFLLSPRRKGRDIKRETQPLVDFKFSQLPTKDIIKTKKVTEVTEVKQDV